MTTSGIDSCPIWGTKIKYANWIGGDMRETFVSGSDRVGCDYKITRDAFLTLTYEGDARVPDLIRVKITTLLIDATQEGDASDSSDFTPTVDRNLIEKAEANGFCTLESKLLRLMEYLNTPRVNLGELMLVSPGPTMDNAMAYTESIQTSEVIELAKELAARGWIELPHGGKGTAFSCSITFNGMQVLENE